MNPRNRARDLLNARVQQTVQRGLPNHRPMELVANDPPPLPIVEIPLPETLAQDQIAEARELLARDISDSPRWGWSDLDRLAGPMLAGDLIVVGAFLGNGKSTLLRSQMDVLAQAKIPTLYFPLEQDPALCRLQWAAWRLGLDPKHVIRQEWSRLSNGAQKAVDLVLQEQEADPYIHFASPRRVTLRELEAWCKWGVQTFGCKVVMLDHLHRMDYGGDTANHRVTVTDVIRQIKDIARELEIRIVAAAQLNRGNGNDPVDQYVPPQITRIAESNAIAQEADVVLMLSRKLRRDLPDKWDRLLKLGQITEAELADPAIMVATIRKHRLDNDAHNKSAVLAVVNGRVENRVRSWEPVPAERSE